MPTESNKSIFKLIRSNKERIEPIETAGIYRINYIDETGKKGAYVCETKRKIIKTAREYQSDIKHERMNTALNTLSRRVNIKIDFKNLIKLANYNNTEYTLLRVG